MPFFAVFRRIYHQESELWDAAVVAERACIDRRRAKASAAAVCVHSGRYRCRMESIPTSLTSCRHLQGFKIVTGKSAFWRPATFLNPSLIRNHSVSLLVIAQSFRRPCKVECKQQQASKRVHSIPKSAPLQCSRVDPFFPRSSPNSSSPSSKSQRRRRTKPFKPEVL